MRRMILSLVGVISFGTIVAQVLAVGILAARGQLSRETFARVNSALAGEIAITAPAPSAQAVAQAAEKPVSDIDQERRLEILNLNARADELRLIKETLMAESERFVREKEAFESSRVDFEKRLEKLRAEALDAGTEQSQSIVKAMQAPEAVAYLCRLEEKDALRIAKGLSERTLAKILQQCAAGADEERRRGEMIFESIAGGQPEVGQVDAVKPQDSDQAIEAAN